MKKLNVAHFCEVFSALSETFLYDYVIGTNKFVSSSVYTFTRQNPDTRPYEKVFLLDLPPKWHYLKILEKIRATVLGRTHDLYFAWPYFKTQILEKFKVAPPQVIHAHFGPTGIFACEIAEELNIPLVVTFYGYDCSVLFRKPEWLQRYQRMFAIANTITVLSENMKEKVAAAGCNAQKIKVVHLAKNISEYQFQNRDSSIRNFITVGRLVEKKGIADSIRAVDLSNKLGTSANLTVIGGGPLLGPLQRLVSDLNIADKIHLLGPLPHGEVKEHFRSADAFILCSKTGSDGDEEGTPTVLMEAQSFGLPCISTIHSGIPETIPKSAHRFLANEGDVHGIAEKITEMCKLLSPEIAAISMEGRRKMEAEFNLALECQKLCDIYENAVKS